MWFVLLLNWRFVHNCRLAMIFSAIISNVGKCRNSATFPWSYFARRRFLDEVSQFSSFHTRAEDSILLNAHRATEYDNLHVASVIHIGYRVRQRHATVFLRCVRSRSIGTERRKIFSDFHWSPTKYCRGVSQLSDSRWPGRGVNENEIISLPAVLDYKLDWWGQKTAFK